LVVGGHAVALHGHPRFTGDLDIWIATDPENAAQVAKVLRDFGFGGLKFTSHDFERPGYAIQLGRPPHRIDILTSVDALEFGAAYAHRVVAKAEGMEVPFLGLNELLTNKLATGRPHDLADVARLKSVRQGSSKTAGRRTRRPGNR
jgi:hypothetical protein